MMHRKVLALLFMVEIAFAFQPFDSHCQEAVKVEQLIQRGFGLSWSKPAKLADSTMILVSDNGMLVRVSNDGKSISRFAPNVRNAAALAARDSLLFVGTFDGRLLQLDSFGAVVRVFLVSEGDTVTDVTVRSTDVWCVTSHGTIASMRFETGILTIRQTSATERWTTVLGTESCIIVAGYRGHVMRYAIAEDDWQSTVLAGSQSVFCGAVQTDSVLMLAGDRASVYSSSDAGVSWSEPIQVFRPYPFSNDLDLASPDNFLHAGIVGDSTWVLTGDFYRSQGVQYTGVYISRDRGGSWQRSALDEHVSDFFYVYGSPTTGTIWSDQWHALAFTSDYYSGCQVLHRTTDAGRTWKLDTILSTGGTLIRDSAGAVVDAALYEWVAMQRVGSVDIGFRIRRPVNATELPDTTDVLLSNDSGRTWMERGRLPFRVRVVTSPAGTLYCSGSGGSVRSSLDSGSTWQALPGLESFGSGIEPIGLAVAQSGAIVMSVAGYHFQDIRVPDGACIVVLDPGAQSWHPSSVSFRPVARTAPSEIATCGDELITAIADIDSSGSHFNFHIYASNDNGTTWAQRTTSPVATWSAVSISSDSHHKIVASFSDSARTSERQALPRICFSMDNGVSWTKRAVIESDSASLFLLGQYGIFWVSMSSNGMTLMFDGAKLWILPRLEAAWQIVPLPSECSESGRTFYRPIEIEGARYVPASRNSVFRVFASQPTALIPLPEVSSEPICRIWPNPTSGNVVLDCIHNEGVQVCSMEGRILFEFAAVTDGPIAFNLQDLPVGPYLVVTSLGKRALLHVVR